MESCIRFLTQYLFFSLHFFFNFNEITNQSAFWTQMSNIFPSISSKHQAEHLPFNPVLKLTRFFKYSNDGPLLLCPHRQTKSTHSLEQYTNTLWIPGMDLWLLKTCTMSETVVNLITRETHTHIYTQGGGIMPGKWPYYCLKALNQAASKYSCTRQGIGQQLPMWHGDECRHAERAMDNILYVWVTTNSLYCINNMLLMHFELHV